MLTNKKYSGKIPLVVGAAVAAAVLMALLPLAGCKNDSVAEPARYTVTFDKNSADATGEMATQSFTAGAAQKLTANGFSRTGYAFAGWAESSGGPAKYTDGQEITVSASTTLYARWQVAASNVGAQAVVVAAGGTRTEYPNLVEALSAAGSQGSTVYPVQDITLTDFLSIPGGSSLTLDLNGRKVSSMPSDNIPLLTIESGASLTVTDSSGLSGSLVSGSNNVVVNSGTLTVSGGNLSSGTAFAVNNTGGTMTVNGGAISATGTGTGVNNSGTLTVSGGSISSAASYAVENFGTMTVTGGTLSCTAKVGYSAVFNWSTATLVVSGGSISSATTSALANFGTLTVSGGTITASDANGIRNDGSNAILRLSGNPEISGSGADSSGVPFSSIRLSAANQAFITGPLAMEGRLTVDCDTAIFQSGLSFSAFKGEGYTITPEDLAKLAPAMTDLPASMTSGMDMPNGATISTSLDTAANAIVVTLAPRQ